MNRIGMNMSIKEWQKFSKMVNTITARALLMVLVIIAALFASVQTAEASGVPTQLIMFTDRKVYTDWFFDQNRDAATPPHNVRLESSNLTFYVYAIVLDDDGNIMKGRTSYLSGAVNDIAQLDHYDKGSSATHHANLPDPNLISGTLSFKDDGSVKGDVAGDG